jgi:DNA-binding PadR family transcriptional regulator
MSSIRLFILSSFDAFGPMHGHALRLIAEQMRVPLWTDISVGAVYGAMNRLATEGLLHESGREQEGNRPTRQIYEITAEGRRALDVLRREGLTEIWFKPDPFDLALTAMDPKLQKSLPAILTQRLESVRAQLADIKRKTDEVRTKVSHAKQWALRHNEYRLKAEVAYLTDLLKAVGDIVREKHEPVSAKDILAKIRAASSVES